MKTRKSVAQSKWDKFFNSLTEEAQQVVLIKSEYPTCCPNCGAKNVHLIDDGTTFTLGNKCWVLGTSLEQEIKFCPYCGFELRVE